MPIRREWQTEMPYDAVLSWQLQKMVDDKRWTTVHARTRVLFNGVECDFSELTGNEKQMLNFNALGMLEGSDPFHEGDDNG